MKSVLHSFLGTFTSRYSDYRGYWLFGQLPAELERFSVDLIGEAPDGDTAIEVAQRLAVRRFTEQVLQSGLDPSLVREAVLQWTGDSKQVLGRHGDFEAWGRNVDFHVRVVMDSGRVFEEQQTVFVAAHDPSKERRRNPVDRGA